MWAISKTLLAWTKIASLFCRQFPRLPSTQMFSEKQHRNDASPTRITSMQDHTDITQKASQMKTSAPKKSFSYEQSDFSTNSKENQFNYTSGDVDINSKKDQLNYTPGDVDINSKKDQLNYTPDYVNINSKENQFNYTLGDVDISAKEELLIHLAAKIAASLPQIESFDDALTINSFYYQVCTA